MSAAPITNSPLTSSDERSSSMPGLSPITKPTTLAPLAPKAARPVRAGKNEALANLLEFTKLQKTKTTVREDSFHLTSSDEEPSDTSPSDESTSSSSYSSSGGDSSSLEDCSSDYSQVSVDVSEASPTPAAPGAFASQSSVTHIRGNIKFVKNKKRPAATASGPAESLPPLSDEAIKAAAAAAPGTGDNPPPNVKAPPPSSPAATWLRQQAFVGPGTAFLASLRQLVALEDGSVTEVERTHVYFGAEHIPLVPTTTRNKTWVDAVNQLDSAGLSHSGFVSGAARTVSDTARSKKARKRTSARVLCLRAVHYIVLETPTVDGKYVPLPCDKHFPPADDGIDQFITIDVLPPSERDGYLAELARPDLLNCNAGRLAALFANTPAAVTNEFARTEGERLRPNVWEQHLRTQEDVVQAIQNIGSVPFRTHRVLPEHLHAPFTKLCAGIFSYDRSWPIERRAKAALDLVTIPHLHLRDDLRGQHSSKRDVYLRVQLAGMVCTLTNKPAAAPAPSRSDSSSLENQAKRAADVLALAAQGRIGAANKRLNRADSPQVPIEETVADLVKLHPDGDNPINVQVPADLHDETSITVNAVRAVVARACHETTPGPDGWTQELLKIALVDPNFATSFRNLVLDICNGVMPDEIDDVLTLSNLIGIPKETGGTRPIAMGQTILKVANTIAVKREERGLNCAFDGSQFGCAAENGTETIVHHSRDFFRTGKYISSDRHAGKQRVMLLLDAHNAFNSPFRQAMHKAILHYGLLGLLGIFKTTYSKVAKMFVVGSKGEHCIFSKRGSRQGESSASFLFAATIQPGIDNIRDNHPNVDPAAYLDDITLLCEDVPSAVAALLDLAAFFESIGMKFNYKKCEIVMPGLVADEDGAPGSYEARVQAAFAAAGVPDDSPIHQFRVTPSIKLLGANIAATSEAEAALVDKRMRGKFDALLERLREVPASPQAFTLLRQCVLPSLTHVARVHHPDVTKQLMLYADAQVQLLLQQWAQSKTFSISQQAFVSAPIKEGGLGIGSAAVTAPAAYAASILAFAAQKAGKKDAIKQRFINQACQLEWASRLSDMDPTVAVHLEATKAAGTILFSGPTARASEDCSGAYLRLVTLSASENAASAADASYSCPGCNSINVGKLAANLTSTGNQRSAHMPLKQWMCHVIGCAAVPGGAVTKRHNAIVDYLCLKLRQAGCSNVEKEPRALRWYDCEKCGLHLDHPSYVEHAKVCKKATERIRTHGPDILYTNSSGEVIAIDVRVVNELASSHQGKSLSSLFAAAEQEKANKYGALCANAGAQLVTFGVSALGALSDSAAAVLKSIATASGLDVKHLNTRVGCLAAAGSAHALLTAEGLIGIRPKPRTLSLAAVKLIGKTLGISLTAVPGAVGNRLGVPAPSTEELAAQIQHLTVLAARVEDSLTTVLQRAQAVKVDEAAEQAREADANDPFFGVRDARIPSLAPARNKSTSAPRASHGPTAAERQENTAQALHEERIASIERDERDLELQLQAASALIDADAARAKDLSDRASANLQTFALASAEIDTASKANAARASAETDRRLQQARHLSVLAARFSDLNERVKESQAVFDVLNMNDEEVLEDREASRQAAADALRASEAEIANSKENLAAAMETAAAGFDAFAAATSQLRASADRRDDRIRHQLYSGFAEDAFRHNDLITNGAVLGGVANQSNTPDPAFLYSPPTNNHYGYNNNNTGRFVAAPTPKSRPEPSQQQSRSAPSQQSSSSSRVLTYSSSRPPATPSAPRAPSNSGSASVAATDYVQQRISHSQASQHQRQASHGSANVSAAHSRSNSVASLASDMASSLRALSRTGSAASSRGSSIAPSTNGTHNSSGLNNSTIHAGSAPQNQNSTSSPAPRGAFHTSSYESGDSPEPDIPSPEANPDNNYNQRPLSTFRYDADDDNGIPARVKDRCARAADPEPRKAPSQASSRGSSVSSSHRF